MSTISMCVRIPRELKVKLDETSRAGAYKISITQIVIRGINLAISELERPDIAEKAKALVKADGRKG